MRPLSARLPKALVRVCGKPLLDYHLEGLIASGVERIVVVCDRFREAIASHVAGRFDNAELVFVRQDPPVGIADAVMRVKGLVRSDFCVVHPDNFFRPGIFDALITSHIAGTVSIAVVAYAGESPRNRSAMEPTTRRLLLGSGPAAGSGYIDVQTTGCGILPACIFGYIAKRLADDPGCDMFAVLSAFQSELVILGVPFEGVWANVNTPDDLRRLEAKLCAQP